MRKLKLTAFLLLVVTVLALTLTACQQQKTSNPAIRWEDSESYTYNITRLSDDESALIKQYNNVDFYNNIQLTSGSEDQLKPDEVSGTYTTDITTDGDKVTLKTNQTLTETYKLPSEPVSNLLSQLTDEQKAKLVVSQADNQVVLKSVTVTETEFKKEASQTPISSYKKIEGYYIGKEHSQPSFIEVTTTYDGTKATVEKTVDGTQSKQENTVYASKFIDATQLYLYARSIDQSTAFEAAPTVYVYDPIQNRAVYVGLTLTRGYRTLLNTDKDFPYSVVNAMGLSTADGKALAVLYNNPKDTMISSVSTSGLNKFTTVKFQSGNYVYELQSYTSEQVEQLKYVVESSTGA